MTKCLIFGLIFWYSPTTGLFLISVGYGCRYMQHLGDKYLNKPVNSGFFYARNPEKQD